MMKPNRDGFRQMRPSSFIILPSSFRDVVSAKLSARAALAASGSLPENVNYAIKSSYLLSFLESVPEVSAKLKEPETKERKFEEVVKSAEQAAVLVLVY